MNLERELSISGGSLYYEIADSGICVTRLQGLAGEVNIPEQIEGLPVRAIGRKAFLSKKNLRKVTLPSSVTEVGDWAFAYCDSLHTVRFLQGAANVAHVGAVSGRNKATPFLHFGKAVFLECGGLRRVYVRDGKDSTAALLAAAVTVAAAPYLLDAQEAGSREWLEKWDARMLAVLHSADDEGYSKQVLCGEEDYGSTDLAAYESERRKMKVRLALLRCLYPEGLALAHREEIEDYLRSHSKQGTNHAEAGEKAADAVGGAGVPDGKRYGQDETWQVVLKEHGEDQIYYELFTKLGCVTEDNFDALLADVGEEHPQLRAYLMRYKEEKLGYSDFFAGLEL